MFAFLGFTVTPTVYAILCSPTELEELYDWTTVPNEMGVNIVLAVMHSSAANISIHGTSMRFDSQHLRQDSLYYERSVLNSKSVTRAGTSRSLSHQTKFLPGLITSPRRNREWNEQCHCHRRDNCELGWRTAIFGPCATNICCSEGRLRLPLKYHHSCSILLTSPRYKICNPKIPNIYLVSTLRKIRPGPITSPQHSHPAAPEPSGKIYSSPGSWAQRRRARTGWAPLPTR